MYKINCFIKYFEMYKINCFIKYFEIICLWE